jgi:hypothetical protein
MIPAVLMLIIKILTVKILTDQIGPFYRSHLTPPQAEHGGEIAGGVASLQRGDSKFQNQAVHFQKRLES